MLFRKTDSQVTLTSRKEPSLSVIAPDVNILGTLISDGVIDFGGTIDGNIRCHTLTVRAHGTVRGDVEVENLHVYGKINGLIRAKYVHLYTGCHVEGIVMHEALTMEDGAFLDGKCKRLDKTSSSDELSIPDAPAEDVRLLDAIRLIS